MPSKSSATADCEGVLGMVVSKPLREPPGCDICHMGLPWRNSCQLASGCNGTNLSGGLVQIRTEFPEATQGCLKTEASAA